MEDLSKFSLGPNPLENFSNWYQQATKLEQNAEAFTLATVSLDGSPNARILLYKGMLEDKILFYTNYNSTKAQELEQNPQATMVFYWHNSKKQVRISGKVEKTSPETSDRYFLSRSFESQIASMASDQSSVIDSREELIEKMNKLKEAYSNKEMERPSNWGGMQLIPTKIEFFIYGEHRINDRFEFKKDQGTWTWNRLQP